MKRRFLLIILLSCLLDYSFGQYNGGDITQVNTTPPTLSELGKYVDIPVGLYTGIPNISVPIYNIKTGGYDMPVSLSYHAGGIKVQQRASWVGLGWSLNAGGAITRVINGRADDKNYYLVGDDAHYKTGLLYGLEEGFTPGSYYHYDHESDIYYFNFSGYSGKFFFDKDGNVHMEEDSPYKITFSPSVSELRAMDTSYNDGITQFTIVTEDGIKYIFGKTEKRITIPTYPNIVDEPYFAVTPDNQCVGFCQFDFQIRSNTDVTAWYLTRIEFPNNDKSITFEYDAYKYSDLERTGQARKNSGVPPFNRLQARDYYITNYVHNLLYYSYSLTLIDGQRLSAINWDNGSLVFNVDANYRKDLDTSSYYAGTGCNPASIEDYDDQERQLKEIVLKDSDGNDKRYFKLSQSYFPRSPGYDPTVLGCTSKWDKNHIYYRLRLDEVYDSVPSGEVKEPYSFEYNEDYLPNRYSNAVDYWGYYNGKETNTDQIPSLYIYPQAFFNADGTAGKKEPGGIDTTLFRSIFFPFEVPRYDVEKTVAYGDGNPATFTIGVQNHTIDMDYTPPNILADITISDNNPSSNKHITVTGADRSVTAGDHNQAYILEKITYPTGGYTEFTYESNSFRLNNVGFTGDTAYGGGVRIKQMDFYDPVNDQTTIKTYSYKDQDGISSGRILDFPLFATNNFDGCSYFNNFTEEFTINFIEDGDSLDLSYLRQYGSSILYDRLNSSGSLTWIDLYLWSINPENIIMFSGSQNELGMTKGNYVGYENVTVDYNGNGKEEYVYDFPNSMDNRGGTLYSDLENDLIRKENYIMEGMTTDYYPFPPNPNSDWDRGQLLSKKVFDENGDLVEKIENEYTISYFDTIRQTRVSSCNSTESYDHLLAYYNITAWKYLNEHKETSYIDLSDTSKNVRTITKYEQNNERLLKRLTTYDSTDDSVVTIYKYPKDYIDDLPSSIQYDIYDDEVIGLRAMNDSNMLNTSIETVNMVDGKVTGGSINTFRVDNYDHIVPYKTLLLESNSPQSVDDDIESGDTQKFNFTHVVYDDYDNAEWSFIEDNLYPDDSKPNFTYSYDSYGNIVQVDKQQDVSTSYIWGYDNKFPVAIVQNATHGEILSENFENARLATWINSACTDDDWSFSSEKTHSGKYSIKIVDDNTYSGFYYNLDISNLDLDGKYTFSTWVNADPATGSREPRISWRIYYNNGSSSASIDQAAQYTGEWEYMETTIDLSDYENITLVRISIINGAWSSTADFCEVYFDDLRVQPSDSNMKTYTYDSLNGIMSESNESNVPVNYEYDEFGRLFRVFDANGHILKQYDYNYAH